MRELTLLEKFSGFLVILHVYWIGFYYSILEFIGDRLRHRLSASELRNQWRTQLRPRHDAHDAQRVAVLTGVDGTIGREILAHLLELGFRVYAVGLSRKLETSDCQHYIKCIFIHADLADFSDVERAAQQIIQAESKVDLLICNAGVMFHPDPYIATKSGPIERHLGVNLMAHVLLFSKVLPVLEHASRRSADSIPNAKAVFLSSATCHAGNLSYFSDGDAWSHCLNAYKSYADSKLFIALYVNELSRWLAQKSCPVTVVSVHPGVIPGSLYRHVVEPLRFLIIHVLQRILRSGSAGAEQVLKLALTQATELVPGAYYEEGITVNVAKGYTRSQVRFLFDETNRRLGIKFC